MSLAVALAGLCSAAALAFELRRRSALLADACHELRGPLAAIALGLEALRRRPEARRLADGLLTELDRAAAAVDDVAAAARGRRAQARAERVAVGALLARSCAAWAPAAERAGGRISFDWPDAADAGATADRRRIAQAFGNLLANAVQHGGADVAVSGRSVDGRLRIEVADRGRDGGAEPRRAPSGSGRRGRGLAIAERALAEAGGRLDSRKPAGGGHVAVAELPLEPAP